MKAKFLTDRGQIRSHNEDSGGIYINADGQILSIVADGMGGHKAGEVASRTAVTILKEKWEQTNKILVPEAAESWLLAAIQDANKVIYKEAMEKEAYEGMGTTVVITVSTKEFTTVAHIGDSRCYILNEHGFKQITEDHTLVNELVRSGQITKGDAGHHPRKNVVLKALGTTEQVEADIKTISWELGNKLLLCSDGLTDKVSDEDLNELIQLNITLEEIGQKMIHLANERGGEDNISLILINYENEEGDSSC